MGGDTFRLLWLLEGKVQKVCLLLLFVPVFYFFCSFNFMQTLTQSRLCFVLYTEGRNQVFYIIFLAGDDISLISNFICRTSAGFSPLFVCACVPLKCLTLTAAIINYNFVFLYGVSFHVHTTFARSFLSFIPYLHYFPFFIIFFSL